MKPWMVSNVEVSISFLSILGKEALIDSPGFWERRGGLAHIHERWERKPTNNQSTRMLESKCNAMFGSDRLITCTCVAPPPPSLVLSPSHRLLINLPLPLTTFVANIYIHTHIYILYLLPPCHFPLPWSEIPEFDSWTASAPFPCWFPSAGSE
jgi:hypothetical protein